MGMRDLYEGTVCIVYLPTGYMSIIVSFIEQIHQAFDPHTVTVQNRSAPFSHLYPLLKMTWLLLNVRKMYFIIVCSHKFCDLMTIDFG